MQVKLAGVGTFDWLVVEMNRKVVWRSALEEFGGQCAMIFGVLMMRELFAGSLVIREEVQVYYIIKDNYKLKVVKPNMGGLCECLLERLSSNL